ncbi:MAG: exodeoxyribonuclease V subunit beta [Deltaproteobacteria bacterium]|nr:MAG: exodeoxyribonuclease V subunit beta [Deltaproteobacteria bacterium]
MRAKYTAFDAARLQMQKGTSLVEASAGTGKTYAICMLVLRGIVELGIAADTILVVTYTKAATEELRNGIRKRLLEARALLLSSMQGEVAHDVDQTLLRWCDGLADKREAISRLELALCDIDRLAIFTIHGFCQKMLRDHALESGQIFQLELQTDTTRVQTEIAEDFWRNEVYTLDAFSCSLFLDLFQTPTALFQSVSQAFHRACPLEPALFDKKKVLQELQAAYFTLRNWWHEKAASLRPALEEAIAENHFKKDFRQDFESWFAGVSAFLLEEGHSFPKELHFLTKEGFLKNINGQKFRGEKKKQAYYQSWELPASEVADFLGCRDRLVLAWRRSLAEMRFQIPERLLLRGMMGFDGLIQNLARAFELDTTGQLKEAVGSRYTLALIDEFQDTDDLQYKIFSRAFADREHYLYLVGDPKQAIYKFRGADIFSYFTARRDADVILTLDTNYRSHPGLVEEVNRLFQGVDAPFGSEESILEYIPVRSALSPEAFDLREGTKSLAAMAYCSLPANTEDARGRWSLKEAEKRLCRYTVSEICTLLAPERELVYVEQETSRGLEARDIAILVRKNEQAELYLEHLLASGVPAVLRSKKSVYDTRECRELLILLDAITRPTDLGALKSAMTISWFNMTGNELLALWEDNERLEQWRSNFTLYHRRWLEQGFFSMLSHLLRRQRVLHNIASLDRAERRIANISQLMELVQEKESSGHYGMAELYAWLQRQHLLQAESSGSEMLLESDENAVRIVTMHSAKGLEYPVVFCPYLWYGSRGIENEDKQILVNEEGRNIVDLGSSRFAERKRQAKREQAAEDMRLLYVALTRAKVRCYVFWAEVKPHRHVEDAFCSPLGLLLFPDGAVDSSRQEDVFAAVAQNPFVEYHAIPLVLQKKHHQRPLITTRLAPGKASGRSLLTDRQVSSFSALARLSEYQYDHFTKDEDDGRPIPVQGLPAGAGFGNAIHELLEAASFQSLADPSGVSHEYRALIQSVCRRYRIKAEEQDILRLLSCTVSTPLPAGFSLADLAPEQCLKEMPFYFKVSTFRAEGLYDILSRDPAVLPVSPYTMQGYLTGFVDLICCWEGRYYILDYKTNDLGNTLSAYDSNALASAMRLHNYGLQFWLYTVVLHRHLQNIIPDYSYIRDFGGVLYLFVRGMSPEHPGGSVYESKPDYQTLQRLTAFFKEEENGE